MLRCWFLVTSCNGGMLPSACWLALIQTIAAPSRRCPSTHPTRRTKRRPSQTFTGTPRGPILMGSTCGQCQTRPDPPPFPTKHVLREDGGGSLQGPCVRFPFPAVLSVAADVMRALRVTQSDSKAHLAERNDEEQPRGSARRAHAEPRGFARQRHDEDCSCTARSEDIGNEIRHAAGQQQHAWLAGAQSYLVRATRV